MRWQGVGSGIALFLSAACAGQTAPLQLVGIVHGPISGAPKAVELYAVDSIADLSQFSLGTANNGSGSSGPEWTFPSVSVAAGTSIAVSKETPVFTAFFNEAPDFVDDGLACNFNGDDAIELFWNGVVIDGYGNPDADGTGSDWEYTLGWAYRDCEGIWSTTMGSMSGISNNSSAAFPFPLGTFESAYAPAVLGCTLPHADNFNPEANEDDGSCLLTEFFSAPGCTYPHATNFDPNATSDDGSCAFGEACPGDVNANGMVEVGDLLEILSHFGQTCTWNPPATGTGAFMWGNIPIHYCVPEGAESGDEVVFVFHGNNRNAGEYRDDWVNAANELGLIIFAPEFNSTDFPGSEAYMQGGMVDANGLELPVENWTFALVEPMIAACLNWAELTDSQVDLWGHSAGGQFVHRFMLFAGSESVNRAVAANSGWYTTTDATVAYPYGMLGAPTGGMGLPAAFDGKLVISLGTADTSPSGPIHTPEADAQGLNRYERGLHFWAAASSDAAASGGDWNWELFEVPGVGHASGEMAEAAAAWLFGP